MQNLLLSLKEKKIVRSLYDDHDGALPDFVFSEKLSLGVTLVKRSPRPWGSRIFEPIDPTSYTIRAALGSYREAVGGTFVTQYETEDSPTPTPAANTLAADLERSLNAIDGIHDDGGVHVTGDKGFFVIGWNEPGARSVLMADATQAIPSLLLEFERIIIGDASNKAVQTLRIEQNIASLGDLDVDGPSLTKEFTVDAGTDVLACVGHGLVEGSKINLKSSGTLPTGVTVNTDYFVIASGLTADAFKVSASSGGASVDMSNAGTGTHSFFVSIIERLTPGSGSQSEKIRITLPEDRWSGEWTVTVAGVTSDLIGWDISAAELQEVFESISSVGPGNVVVNQESDDSLLIRFKGSRANQAVAVTADPTDLRLVQSKSGVLDLQNAQVQFLFDDGQKDTVVTLELEITDQSGNTDKPQFDSLLRRPVIKLDSVIAPFPASSYYTKDQIDAILAGIAGDNQHKVDEFAATNGQTVYPLTETPSDTPLVFIRGLLQLSTSFSVVGDVLTLVSGADIVTADEVLVFYFY